MTKEFQRAVMKKQKQTEATKAAYNFQRNICVSLLRKSKMPYFENLDVKLVRDKINFRKTLRLFFLIKSNLKRKTQLLKLRISFQTIKKLLEPSTNSLVT